MVRINLKTDNHLFSPVALLDGNGDIAERYEYNAYGKVQVLTDSDGDGNWFDDTDDSIYSQSQVGNPYLFTGRRLDVLDSGDYEIMYYRNRYYNTYTGRFLTQDPLEYVAGMNLYEYCVSNPSKFVDSQGTVPAAVVYWGVRIGISAFAASAAWDHHNAEAEWQSLKGKTDIGKVSETAFEGSSGGTSSNPRQCPVGNWIDTVYSKTWERALPWGRSRSLKIQVVWNIEGGNINGHLKAYAEGTNPDAGFMVTGINAHGYSKVYECECKKKVPCISMTIQVRDVYDQPWPIPNHDETIGRTFYVCADGSKGIQR